MRGLNERDKAWESSEVQVLLFWTQLTRMIRGMTGTARNSDVATTCQLPTGANCSRAAHQTDNTSWVVEERERERDHMILLHLVHHTYTHMWL